MFVMSSDFLCYFLRFSILGMLFDVCILSYVLVCPASVIGLMAVVMTHYKPVTELIYY